MNGFTVRRGRPSDSRQFMGLLVALAKFERLKPPSNEGRKRILEDVFERKRISLFVAVKDRKLIGYALYFYTYSSFLAKPTLYLEDLFVLDEHRKSGVGFALFRRCVDEAVKEGCGRMEWSVLKWNEKALKFYERLGAKRMSEWVVYRLDERALSLVPSRAS
ncbi:MAG TPA: GNAT family N-acetyltransferase [Nitrososphaerales archaeon]|nr:GNAT family N-acetyltransferase [Nitrososphaerales archaeon]